ncbi:anti-sigma factor [Sphingomonas sp. KR1UV-12]|uniref:Anti-sigma factor n=1 Tax=Sphingomonas aurea TaxID=3063994 RepID=A0ABT9EJR7_9SPHN|nr:anti-sigma factor [Sphingomonas sp. KR1UV-12]MDP1027212.1 anti-sigma factor [Sphingomonas sp. KR1UV-12]
MAIDEDTDMAAAELALGLIEGEERAAALRRVLADPGFAAEVERWRQWLAQLFDLWPEVEPPAELIDRIDASLGGVAMPRVRRFPWPLLAIASSALAACLLVIVALRPGGGPPPGSPPIEAPAPEAAQPTLVAAIGGEGAAVAASFDPGDGSLRVTAAPKVPAGRAAQLWVIGGDGVPHALGLLARDATLLALPQADRVRIAAGATLAISVEPPGGSPTGKPTGPVIATGALAAV